MGSIIMKFLEGANTRQTRAVIGFEESYQPMTSQLFIKKVHHF
jgi:hypothetical protein